MTLKAQRGFQRFQRAFKIPSIGNILLRNGVATEVGVGLRDLGTDSCRNLFHNHYRKPGKIARDSEGQLAIGGNSLLGSIDPYRSVDSIGFQLTSPPFSNFKMW
jgi:hypothetical protein